MQNVKNVKSCRERSLTQQLCSLALNTAMNKILIHTTTIDVKKCHQEKL